MTSADSGQDLGTREGDPGGTLYLPPWEAMLSPRRVLTQVVVHPDGTALPSNPTFQAQNPRGRVERAAGSVPPPADPESPAPTLRAY